MPGYVAYKNKDGTIHHIDEFETFTEATTNVDKAWGPGFNIISAGSLDVLIKKYPIYNIVSTIPKIIKEAAAPEPEPDINPDIRRSNNPMACKKKPKSPKPKK